MPPTYKFKYLLSFCLLAVGIDLGTTFSVIGVNDNGKVIIIPDKQGKSFRTTKENDCIDRLSRDYIDSYYVS